MANENNNENNLEAKKVEFTPEQQEFVNKTINERFAKIQQKHETEVERLKAEAEAAKKAAEEAASNKNDDSVNKDNKDNKDNKGHQEDDEKEKQYKSLLDNEKNRTKLAEQQAVAAKEDARKAREEALRVRKVQAMRDAMRNEGFYQPDDVLDLTDKKVIWDDDSKEFVVKENGVIKQNSSLQNMTLEEYYKTFAAERPYLVNGNFKGGAGSRESEAGSVTAGLVKTKADLKSAKEKSDWIKKNGFEAYEQLPLK